VACSSDGDLRKHRPYVLCWIGRSPIVGEAFGEFLIGNGHFWIGERKPIHPLTQVEQPLSVNPRELARLLRFRTRSFQTDIQTRCIERSSNDQTVFAYIFRGVSLERPEVLGTFSIGQAVHDVYVWVR